MIAESLPARSNVNEPHDPADPGVSLTAPLSHANITHCFRIGL